jgi:hypothetical protein
MPRFVALLAILISSAAAAILPEQLGANPRTASAPLQIASKREVWDEYGLEAAERADYGSFRVTAYQFKDTTGAFAAAQWLKATDTGAATLGNYVLSCSGKCPPAAKLAVWLGAGSLPKLSHAAYPTLESYLPKQAPIGGSKRYILGPASLAQFEPRLPASAVAFDFSSEVQLARYHGAKGDETLAIIAYPTPQMARQQAAVLEKLPDTVAKRIGPMVAVVIAPASPAAAGRLLSQISYQASVSSDDQTLALVVTPQTAGSIVLGAVTLAAMVLGFCVLSGLAFGSMRIVARKFGYSDARYAITTLHLSDQVTPRISPR